MLAARRRRFDAVGLSGCRPGYGLDAGCGRLTAAIAVAMALLTPAAPGRSAAAGPDLMQTLVAVDVTLNNNLIPLAVDLESARNGRRMALGFGAEKQLSEHLGITITGQYDISSPRQEGGAADFGNVDFGLKYVFPGLPERDFNLALAGGVSIPTNSHLGSEPLYAQTELALAWGGRLSQVAASGPTGYLRAVEIQGDVGYLRNFDSEGSAGFFLDPVVDYSMPYLNYTDGGAVAPPLRYLCPFIELNLLHAIGSGAGQRSELFLMPGLAFLTETLQVSAGAQVALDHETARNTQLAIIGSILIFLDAIDPRFGRMLF